MKKAFAVGFAALMVTSALAGCSAPQNLSETASAAGIAQYTEYLENNLDEMPDSLVVATAENSAAYGVDMTGFASDGYFTRADNGDVVILGKTDAGLDRAVRDYVKYGNDDNYFKVYNEGYRVKKLTIAGNDISEYAVIRADDADECNTYAASELVKYVQKTCGAVIPSYTVSEYAAATDKPARTITLTVDYPALGDESFRIELGEDGNLTIFGGRYRGCMFGVYDLLRDMGWRFFGSNFYTNSTGTSEYLYESEHVDLTADINRTEEPDIPIRRTGTGELRNLENGATDNNYARGGYEIVSVGGHGLQSYHYQIFVNEEYEGLDKTGKQPCFTNEEILAAIETWAYNHVKAQVEAGKPVEEIEPVDVGQWDGFEGSFCTCKTCIRVFREEKATSGAFFRMANRVASMLDENFPGVCVKALAYSGTHVPPAKTVPNHNVYISFCYHTGTNGSIACNNHSVSGDDCTLADRHTNIYFAKEFEGWMEFMNPDRVQVWYYPFTAFDMGFNSPYYTVLLEDMQYFASYGISQIFLCSNITNNGLVNESLASYLCSLFSWDSDYTKEEMHAVIAEYFDIVYGDAGYYMYEYTMMCEVAANKVGCWCGFHSASTAKVDHEYMAENYDYMYELYQKGKAMADTTKHVELVERYMAGMMYICTAIVHEDQYLNGTEEQRAVVAERYIEMHKLFRKYNLGVFYDLLSSPTLAPEELDLEVNPRVWSGWQIE